MSRARLAVCIAAALVGTVSAAAAQTSRPPARAARFMISAGLLLNGGYELGDRGAELRGNGGASAAPFTLFRADTAMDRAAGLDGRIAYALARRLAIEVGGTWSKPQVSVTVTRDAESSGTTLIAETVSQYTVDVSALVDLRVGRGTGRLRPYALGGAGYLRQLHEDRLLAETGHTIFGGGGIRYLFRASPRGRTLGVRADARLLRRVGGIDFEDASRRYAAFSLLGFAVF